MIVGLLGAVSTLFGMVLELLLQSRTCLVTLGLAESGNADSKIYYRYITLVGFMVMDHGHGYHRLMLGVGQIAAQAIIRMMLLRVV